MITRGMLDRASLGDIAQACFVAGYHIECSRRRGGNPRVRMIWKAYTAALMTAYRGRWKEATDIALAASAPERRPRGER